MKEITAEVLVAISHIIPDFTDAMDKQVLLLKEECSFCCVCYLRRLFTQLHHRFLPVSSTVGALVAFVRRLFTAAQEGHNRNNR